MALGLATAPLFRAFLAFTKRDVEPGLHPAERVTPSGAAEQ